jgi:hypothetical protein
MAYNTVCCQTVPHHDHVPGISTKLAVQRHRMDEQYQIQAGKQTLTNM